MSLSKLAKEPKTFLGTRPLLFDRLIDDDLNSSFETNQAGYLSVDEVKDSIATEISRLLNTRTGEKLDNLLGDEPPAFGIPSIYGLKDFGSYDAANTQDWGIIKNLILEAIAYFEPRLKDVDVEIINFDDQAQKLNIQIYGKLHLKKVEGEVTFPVAISPNS